MPTEPTNLGTVKRLGFDETNHERRERLDAIVECPRCGEELGLIADTEAWTKGRDGRWEHSEYGPAMGVCCGLLFADSWDGCRTYELGGKMTPDTPPLDLGPDLRRRINARRTAPGLSALRAGSAPATRAAMAHAADLAARRETDEDRFGVGSDGSGVEGRLVRHGETSWTVAAEVSARTTDIDTAMDLWMDSPDDRTILLGAFDEVVGARAGDYFVAIFLRRPR